MPYGEACAVEAALAGALAGTGGGQSIDLRTVPARFAQLGDPHAGIDDVAYDLTPLLEWVERDERAGQGDLPYPPDHPKMPGEPMRVQPSRAKRPTSGPDVQGT